MSTSRTMATNINMSDSTLCESIKQLVYFQRLLGLSVVYIDKDIFKVSHVLKNAVSILRFILNALLLKTHENIMSLMMQNSNLIYNCFLIMTFTSNIAVISITILHLHNENKLCRYLNKVVKIEKNMREQGVKIKFFKINSIFWGNFLFRLFSVIFFQLNAVLVSNFERVLLCYLFLIILHYGVQFNTVFYFKKCMFSSINRYCKKLSMGEELFVEHKIVNLRKIHQELCHVSRNLEEYFGLTSTIVLGNAFNYLFFLMLAFATTVDFDHIMILSIVIFLSLEMTELFSIAKTSKDFMDEVNIFYINISILAKIEVFQRTGFYFMDLKLDRYVFMLSKNV